MEPIGRHRRACETRGTDGPRPSRTMTGRLEIVRYDPTWPEAFARERERIAAALGDLAARIDHHGSTAVPGLGAKPIIDIQVSGVRAGLSCLQPRAATSLPPIASGSAATRTT